MLEEIEQDIEQFKKIIDSKKNTISWSKKYFEIGKK